MGHHNLLVYISMTQRFVAFGCSYTYGQGLADCHVAPDQPGPLPSKLGWVQKVADQLGLDAVNKGRPGYGNISILQEILTFDFRPNDIVTVMWSYRSRDTILDPIREPVFKGRWDKKWLKEQNIYTLVVKNMFHMHHAQCYLKSLGLEFYFMDIDYTYNFGDHNPSWFKDIKIVDAAIDKFDRSEPLGLDNLHPGPIFHAVVAKKLLAEIKK